ncbi:ABC transporter substrate-binding protein [Rhodovulum visakhapatnamense]|uniref:Amino acid/amide ABC transporter substrate-binding protein (HAAT family) n=1 Tax=Rhodovulum visakhapatnamense TaxID=364297 RepID=A0A4R8G1I6_9RHOB|nr:ABC transporter substrate-binding protein [Rhodovulum visakhapatnamense]TDX33615.1 amino acid/amide ABC transporter substrate-binding protein (HAAT family) [Rhodovulum visakhapatnamense]
MRAVSFLLLMLVLACPPTPGRAAGGIDRDSVRFAQLATTEGPSGDMGADIRDGLLAAFDEVNRAGGVRGRKLLLDTFDDHYEPGRAIVLARDVAEGDTHAAFIGQVGTATLKAVLPVANRSGMPMIAPFTGADFARAETAGRVLNLRPSYDQETEAAVAELVDRIGLKRIAVFYQDDYFGAAGRDGVIRALARRDLEMVAEGRYTRNTVAVKVAALMLADAAPDAVILVASAGPAARMMGIARELGLETRYLALSTVDPATLAAEAGADAAGTLFSEAVPSPFDTDLPVASDYRAALKAALPEATPGFGSFEGYLSGRLAIEALREAGAEPTRDKLAEALDRLGDIDLGGLVLRFGPGDRQGLDAVGIYRLTGDGTLVPAGTAPSGT